MSWCYSDTEYIHTDRQTISILLRVHTTYDNRYSIPKPIKQTGASDKYASVKNTNVQTCKEQAVLETANMKHIAYKDEYCVGVET